ncbi:MAG: ATP synthase subunit I, partial [Acidaminococcaceae bacterium]
MLNYNNHNILGQLKTIFFRQFLVIIVIVLAAHYLWGLAAAKLWAVGCLWSMVDTAWMFRGVKNGLGVSPAASARVMRRNMLERLAMAVALVLVMLKWELSVFGVLTSFLLLHISLILNLIIIA